MAWRLLNRNALLVTVSSRASLDALQGLGAMDHLPQAPRGWCRHQGRQREIYSGKHLALRGVIRQLCVVP